MTINVSTTKLLKVIQFSLLVAIFGLLLWSTPWDNNSSSSTKRTIKVSGESTIKATPDEFTFNPYFQETGADQEAIKTSLTEKANSAVEKLKELGVDEKDITLDASSYDRWYYRENEKGTLNIRLEIIVADNDIVQKVQDYLLTLDVEGQISPQATFSTAKQKELDAQAVEEASNDAISKAETQAKLFNAKLGDAITIQQGSDSIFYGYGVIDSISLATEEDVSVPSSLPVLPGQNEYTQTMTVTYELK
jgi:uncharacterized protein YggE